MIPNMPKNDFTSAFNREKHSERTLGGMSDLSKIPLQNQPEILVDMQDPFTPRDGPASFITANVFKETKKPFKQQNLVVDMCVVPTEDKVIVAKLEEMRKERVQ